MLIPDPNLDFLTTIPYPGLRDSGVNKAPDPGSGSGTLLSPHVKNTCKVAPGLGP